MRQKFLKIDGFFEELQSPKFIGYYKLENLAEIKNQSKKNGKIDYLREKIFTVIHENFGVNPEIMKPGVKQSLIIFRF